MKITLPQLPNFLSGSLLPVYFISSNEILLVEEAAALIRQAAHKNDITERDVFHVEKGFAWQNLLSSSKNLSLFDDQKLLELHLNSTKIEAAGVKILEEYFANPPQDKILLIIAPKLESGWQKIKWLKALEAKYPLVQIWPIDAAKMPGWINQRMKNKGLMASFEACKILAEKSEGNLLAAAQEIDKLALQYGKKKIEAEDIVKILDNNSHYDIFALQDAILHRNPAKVITVINNLQMEGVEPVLVLWLLARTIRMLFNVINSNSPFEDACKKEQVFIKQIPLVKNILKKYSSNDFTKMFQHAAKIDTIIKGVSSGNAWTEISKLALSLT